MEVSGNVIVNTLYMQKIMDKFEFFPIKCRVQRAAEIQKEFLDNYTWKDKGIYADTERGQKKPEMKVLTLKLMFSKPEKF